MPRSPDIDDLQLEIIRLKARIAELEGDVKDEEDEDEEGPKEGNEPSEHSVTDLADD